MDEEEMVEEYLDACGRVRRFRVGVHVPGFLEAQELRPGGDIGLRIVMAHSIDLPPPWGEVRDRIRERLSQRDIVRDKQGELQVLHRKIRAQIVGRDDDETPTVFVDDSEMTWADLGRALVSYDGFGLRIEICDPGEE